MGISRGPKRWRDRGGSAGRAEDPENPGLRSWFGSVIGDGIARFKRVSTGVQIVNRVDGGSSVWGIGSGSVRVAIWQTCLTSDDTIWRE